jgi:phage/plasmid-like protein (TIGR03299 family)
MPADFEAGMFYRKPAWHGLGTVVDEYPGSWDEARKLGGIEWEPITAPSFGFAGIRADGTPTYDPADAVAGEYLADIDKQRIVRNDTGALLGVPTQDYKIISNGDLGRIVEAILGQRNVKFETVVCLTGGKLVATIIKLDEPFTVNGDNSPTYPYLAITTRHDGTGACRAQWTTVRVVCANTFSMAEAEADRDGTVFTFAHDSQWSGRLEEARETLLNLRREFKAYGEFANVLAETKVSAAQERHFVQEFIPTPLGISDRVRKNIEEDRDALKAILAGPTCEAVRFTGYGLLQGGTEFLDHVRGYRNRETYMGRQILRPEKRKLQAVNLIREIVKV